MRLLLSVVTLLVLTGSVVRAQDPPPNPVTGTTQCNFGNVTQGNPAGNGDIIVSFEVTRELSSQEMSFTGETTEGFHVTMLGDTEIGAPTALTVTRGAGGTPTPGGGPVTITYTVVARAGWDLRFEANLKYKDTNNTAQTLQATPSKRYKVTGS